MSVVAPMIDQVRTSWPQDRPTLWGLEPMQVHDRFWASRGVQVIRPGSAEPLASTAELFLLLEEHTLTIFRMGKLIDTLSWLKPRILLIRLHSMQERGYREVVLSDGEDRFLRFKRLYSDADARLARVAVTPDRHLARRWQEASGARAGWRLLRRTIPRSDRTAVSIDGSVYDGADPAEWMPFMRELVQVWRRPDLTVPRACQRGGSLWCDQSVLPDGPTRFIGPVWIGAGRQLAGVDSVVGPAVLWDDPAARPPAPELPWRRLEPVGVLHEELQPRHLNRVQRASKRLFDIVFSLIVLALTLPLYPLIMLAIWLDDGPPFFFIHRRETMGGRQFPCLKFRSMRRNAERLKEQVAHQNLADGPQFYIERDPRLTRVGRWLRALNLDELPQFINVLLGHMSVVGPRPSPYEENQYCPPWREARLSVRPGITGLWQIKRSRAQGLDFQEWIRYDIEYVENMSWKLDLWIIWQTLLHLLHLRRG